MWNGSCKVTATASTSVMMLLTVQVPLRRTCHSENSYAHHCNRRTGEHAYRNARYTQVSSHATMQHDVS